MASIAPSSTDEKPRSTQGEDVQNPEYPSGFKLFAIILALCLAVLLVALDQSIVATAIPRITDQFKSVLDIGWYGSVSILSHSFTYHLGLLMMLA
jgi:Co/Zn/Cd efflux system component